MRLSLQDKAVFYQHTARLLNSGISLPQAIERLLTTAGMSTRRFLRSVSASLQEGSTFSEALIKSGAVSEMEQSAITSLERTGRMEQGLRQLSDYFTALAQSRNEIWRRSAYPVFILHFGILIMYVPLIFTGSASEYLRRTGTLLGIFYGIALVVAVLFPILKDAGAKSAFFDQLLRTIPWIGKIRRSFSLARFCSAYDMQLDSGVNVIDSLLAASRASQSGMVTRAVDAVIPHVRNGEQVGPLLAQFSAFPRDMKQALQVAEDTGSLDEELPRLATEFQNDGLIRLRSFSEWFPRLIYFGVVLFLAYHIVDGYRQYVNGVMSQIDSL